MFESSQSLKSSSLVFNKTPIFAGYSASTASSPSSMSPAKWRLHFLKQSGPVSSLYCFNHIHIDTATIKWQTAMGEIHCMYTSANKPISVFFGSTHWVSPYFPSTSGSAVNRTHSNSTRKCAIYCSINRQSWMGFLHYMTRWRRPMMEKQQNHPATINPSPQPMMSICPKGVKRLF